MTPHQQRLVAEHLVVALDVDRAEAAVELAEALGERVACYKVGPHLFVRHGPELLDRLSDLGAALFLDLKFHDIPHTVEGAVEAAADRGDVILATIHASGGREMVARAARAAGGELRVVAVTALTSLDEGDVREIVGEETVQDWATRLADLGLAAGAGGLVCSPREVGELRERHGDAPVLVTPGIRPRWAAADDQARTTTPREALEAGSDYLVMGRPIYRADDPVRAVEKIGETLPETP